MKVIYAWLARSCHKKGDIELLGFNVSGKEPEGWADIANCEKTRFYIGKGDTIEGIKEHLKRKKQEYNYINPRDKKLASYKIQGSERAYVRARFAPLRATGYNVNML